MTELLGRDVFSGEPISVSIANGVVEAIEPVAPAEGMCWIGPGLVDIQVNGYAGFDLNGEHPSADDVMALTRSLLGVGVTSYLPTVITAAPDAIEQRIAAIVEAIERDPLSERTIAGIHLEGPFISPEDGARGAHPRDAVQAPDWSLFAQWQQRAGARIRIVTLSPEWSGSEMFITQLSGQGVLAAIGHTAATPEQIHTAIQAGARLSTHLGNGAHAMLPRHPNYLWEQLAADQLWASFIADGFHLPDAVVTTIVRMKGDRAILVSDSVALAGMPPGEYATPVGQTVVLTPEGRLHLAEDPRLLAGSAQPMLAGIAHLLRSGLATLADAWAMGSIGPSRLLESTSSKGLQPGAPADLVRFSLLESGEVAVLNVYKDGARIGPESLDGGV